MDYSKFQELKKRFAASSLDEKISLYVNTPDLTKDQYKELLQMYPKDQWHLLDQALW